VEVNKTNKRVQAKLDKGLMRIESSALELASLPSKVFVFQGGFADSADRPREFQFRFIMVGVGTDREVDLFSFGESPYPSVAKSQTGKKLGNVQF
jgi:hypothetical protein